MEFKQKLLTIWNLYLYLKKILRVYKRYFFKSICLSNFSTIKIKYSILNVFEEKYFFSRELFVLSKMKMFYLS